MNTIKLEKNKYYIIVPSKDIPIINDGEKYINETIFISPDKNTTVNFPHDINIVNNKKENMIFIYDKKDNNLLAKIVYKNINIDKSQKKGGDVPVDLLITDIMVDSVYLNNNNISLYVPPKTYSTTSQICSCNSYVTNVVNSNGQTIDETNVNYYDQPASNYTDNYEFISAINFSNIGIKFYDTTSSELFNFGAVNMFNNNSLSSIDLPETFDIGTTVLSARLIPILKNKFYLNYNNILGVGKQQLTY